VGSGKFAPPAAEPLKKVEEVVDAKVAAPVEIAAVSLAGGGDVHTSKAEETGSFHVVRDAASCSGSNSSRRFVHSRIVALVNLRLSSTAPRGRMWRAKSRRQQKRLLSRLKLLMLRMS